MEKYSKGDLAIFCGSFCTGGTISISLLWTGSAADWWLIGLKFLGLLGAGAATAFASVLGKHYGEKIIKRFTNDKENKRAA